MMVPGVSGGSMAMVLGIYGKLITAVSSFFKDIKNNLKSLGIKDSGERIYELLKGMILDDKKFF